MARGTDKDDAFYFPKEQLYAIAEETHEFITENFVAGKPYRTAYSNTCYSPTCINGQCVYRIRNEDGQDRLVQEDDIWTILKESALTPEQRRMAGLPTEDATIAELRERIDALEKGTEQTLKSIDQRIEALETREPVEEKAEPEWPREDDEYFWITSGGMAAMSHWGNIIIDEERCKFLGIYKTQEEAERRAKQVRIVIKELNNGHPVKLRDGQGTLMP